MCVYSTNGFYPIQPLLYLRVSGKCDAQGNYCGVILCSCCHGNTLLVSFRLGMKRTDSVLQLWPSADPPPTARQTGDTPSPLLRKISNNKYSVVPPIVYHHRHFFSCINMRPFWSTFPSRPLAGSFQKRNISV